MQSMQRSFGKLLSKGPGDNAKVSVMLNDFDDADKVLAKIIDSARSWRDSWIALATTQLGVVTEYEGLYDPIVGATDGHGKEMAQTSPEQLHRTLELCKAYRGLKDELLEEAAQIDVRVIKPATDARDCIQPIRKTIKKRENKRFDYEKQQEKVNKLSKKASRTAKEESQLSKAQDEMQNLAEEFHIADAHLRETLPPIVAAAFSLIPPLLGSHVMVQNKLLGLYYTILNQYCEENGFPSPPPPMEHVVADWNASFKPVQIQVEAIGCVARGKAIHLSMRLKEDDPNNAGPPGPARRLTAPGLDSNGTRRPSGGLIQSNGAANASGAPRTMRIPSMPSPRAPSPQPNRSPNPGFAAHLRPTDFTTASVLGQDPAAASPAVVRPRPLGHAQTEYFGHQTSSAVHVSPHTTPQSSTASTFGALGGLKKKPPPPPPPKRIPSATRPPEEFVVALYAFPGQGSGDLAFEAGDRIKIVRKTNKADDWWEGELAGVRGSFPANYCQAT